MSEMSKEKPSFDASFVTAITTEYWALQSARSGTIFESSGRITGFLSTLSSFVVALAFIGQVSELGRSFFIFAFLLLPILFLIGVMTYGRVLQNGLEDLLVTRGMGRLRHALVEIAPSAKDYFVLSTHDDVIGHLRSMALDPHKRQVMFTAATMVALINSVVVGVFVGLVIVVVFSTGIEVGAISGAVGGISVALLFMRHENNSWRRAETIPATIFPSEPVS